MRVTLSYDLWAQETTATVKKKEKTALSVTLVWLPVVHFFFLINTRAT